VEWVREGRRSLKATLTTTLSPEEALEHLREAFQSEGYDIVREGAASLRVRRQGPTAGLVRLRRSEIHASVAADAGGSHVELTLTPIGWWILKSDAEALGWYLEGLEEFLREREDLASVDGVVGKGGASLRSATRGTLVPAKIEFPNEAVRVSEWYVVPMRILALIVFGVGIALARVVKDMRLVAAVLVAAAVLVIAPTVASRRTPSTLRATRSGITLVRGKDERKIPWDRVEGIVPRGSASTDVLLAVRDEKPRIRLSQMCSWRLQDIMERREKAEKVREYPWLFPDWRVVRGGMAAKLPNRTPTPDECRTMGVRMYFLRDPRRTLVVVPEEGDVESLMRAAKAAWGDGDALRSLMKDAALEGYHGTAGTLAARLREIVPGDEEAFKIHFGSLMELKETEEAAKLVNAFLAEHPDSSNAHLARSAVLKDRGRIEDALYEVGRAVDLDGNNLEALRLWATIVSDEGGTAQAISELDYLAHAHPENWGPYYALGELMASKAAMDEAEKYLRKSLDVSVSDEAVGLLSALYGTSKRHKELVALVEDARKSRSLGPAPILNLFSAYMELGRISEAKRCLRGLKDVKDKEWLPAIAEAEARIAR
jgi:tetratricopeptide (TPR) repeat protein